MATFVGRIARVVNRLPHFAEVEVEVRDDAPGTIEFRLEGGGFTSQGSIENASEKYTDWIEGARLGIAFASTSSSSPCSLRVLRISGISSDTNPSIVAAASARAAWEAMAVEPPPDDLKQVDECAFSSWGRDAGWLPTEELTRRASRPRG